ncbi:uncharacterized protein LOC102800483 [Saccoglossus kowalevskii]|uniref:Exosome component 10-like n=1 Tax=Saccoglossus kowalevskii TaxID=10224 RepID=A0ABM0MHX9_SACKO|nr:PREDICTED: exosome component 10-like [Saccoglossus kowalevskii]
MAGAGAICWALTVKNLLYKYGFGHIWIDQYYLPKKTVSQIPSSILESDKITIDGKEAEIQAEHVRPTIENDLWKMKPSTDVKPSEASSKKVTINRGDSAKKRQRVESEEEPAKSLREQGVPKKKRKWMEKEVAKKDKASTSVDNRHSEGRVFHPFDYTKADYKAFEETKKSKKKSSATGGRQGSSFQNAPRSRTAPHTGKKSMTYSSHPKGGHQKGRFNWPKK